jgi:hypothetical protein
MGIGPIPITAIHDYIDRYELPEWCIEALLRLDQEWLRELRGEVNAHG